MNKLKFGPIEEKLEEIVVEGQGCRSDCTRYYWKGNESSKNKKCYKKKLVDAHWSASR
ncbi:hypothetical protein [uncultured Clostridium sp.]|mgnify:CR=1 FL=1|uniref:hypothetical protein n=1 Tax=uncultured Clostridium sp. TaxID=59620 RepID=UPI0025D16C20|nr:hypothetical protein [uncultured Clostridium sp.]